MDIALLAVDVFECIDDSFVDCFLICCHWRNPYYGVDPKYDNDDGGHDTNTCKDNEDPCTVERYDKSKEYA